MLGVLLQRVIALKEIHARKETHVATAWRCGGRRPLHIVIALKEIRSRALRRRLALQHSVAAPWKEIRTRRPPLVDTPQRCKETRVAWL
ncbi:unnamed protein product [Sphagnum troendelagicum]|uniref:Uncharacterized protein n=1 Tax=Sphagnum troendelagicum TaxID=128251 RepID=A0ABP0U5W2_9BRYO